MEPIPVWLAAAVAAAGMTAYADDLASRRPLPPAAPSVSIPEQVPPALP